MQMERTISAGQLHQLSVEIDRALAKLDDGGYGVCEACGCPIAEERLEVLPWATLCVSCKATGRVLEESRDKRRRTSGGILAAARAHRCLSVCARRCTARSRTCSSSR